MSQQSDSPKSITSGETLAIWRRVRISGATVVYADATHHGIGVTQAVVGTSGDEATIRLDTQGTQKGVATGAISAGAAVYAAADGKIASSGTVELGKCLEAATAANDVIEYVPEADKAVGVSDVNVWISDYVWASSDVTANTSDIVVLKSDITTGASDITVNASNLSVMVSDALLAHAAGDWANVSDIKVTIAEIIAAMSDALL